jgi:proline iminopeptidase
MCGSVTAVGDGGYLDYTGLSDRIAGGVRMIPVSTRSGDFRVWTKRVGNNPRIKVLLLHGGPAATHEYLESFDGWIPQAGVQYYYYDQLGSHYSDQPDDNSLWEVDRFVDEVEQVRTALDLGPNNFYLYGHSWGGALAIEYALAHQEHLKGLIISNMMASIPAYNAYAETVLMPAMDQAALGKIRLLESTGRTHDPAYEALLMEHYYADHICRLPLSEWPEPVVRSFAHINQPVYTLMQGPSELGASGRLAQWDRTAELPDIAVPTLVIGAQHDTMDPHHLQWMAAQLPSGTYHHCPKGSHLALVDDAETYFEGLTAFLHRVDAGA